MTENKPCCISERLLVVLILAISFAGFTFHYNRRVSHILPPKCASTNLLKGTSLSTNSFDINYVEENLNSLDQLDPQLIKYARMRHLTPPSKLAYNFHNRNSTFQEQFSVWVANFFGNKRGGIFIEAGANDGETVSHTLYLEKALGWTGLLVECNPMLLPHLKTKHRKAWIADVCLSRTRYAGTLNFSNPISHQKSATFQKPWNIRDVKTEGKTFDVPTMPLYTILAALGWTEVDYFSFDIEGQELLVLNNFPFDLITFKILIVQSYVYYEYQLAEMDNLLRANGYVFVKRMDIDRIYVHKKYKSMIAANSK